MRAIDFFDKGARLSPDRTAIIDGDRKISFAELTDMSFQFARGLWAAGAEMEELVALYAPNDPRVLVTLLGMWRAGATWIPVNPRNALDANIQYLNYVRAKWLFYHSSFAEDVAELKAKVPSFTRFVCIDKEDGDVPSMAQFMESGKGQPDVDWADPFGNLMHRVGIFPTGGTTGPAKGMNVTNLGWGTMLHTMANYMKVDGVDPVLLTSAPLTHAAGPVAMVCFIFGATNVVLPGFDAGKVLEAIEKHKVTHMFLPPTALYGLLDHPDRDKFDTSSLKRFLLVGSSCAPGKLKQAVEVFGPCMCQSYGQVECPMTLTFFSPEDVADAAARNDLKRLSSCGKESYAVRAAIMDDDGNLLGQGQEGEIVARGALVSHSYFEKPEATAEIRTHGWHHTGDVGVYDEDGFFYIVDRKKDMIVTGGFNVYTTEVEGAVMELPQVKECAVVGVPDEKWGEAVKAIVALAQGQSLTEDEVIAHCKKRLGSVKSPKSVEFWPEVPRTPNGKPDKKGIRAKFWSGKSRQIGGLY